MPRVNTQQRHRQGSRVPTSAATCGIDNLLTRSGTFDSRNYSADDESAPATAQLAAWKGLERFADRYLLGQDADSMTFSYDSIAGASGEDGNSLEGSLVRIASSNTIADQQSRMSSVSSSFDADSVYLDLEANDENAVAAVAVAPAKLVSKAPKGPTTLKRPQSDAAIPLAPISPTGESFTLNYPPHKKPPMSPRAVQPFMPAGTKAIPQALPQPSARLASNNKAPASDLLPNWSLDENEIVFTNGDSVNDNEEDYSLWEDNRLWSKPEAYGGEDTTAKPTSQPVNTKTKPKSMPSPAEASRADLMVHKYDDKVAKKLKGSNVKARSQADQKKTPKRVRTPTAIKSKSPPVVVAAVKPRTTSSTKPKKTLTKPKVPVRKAIVPVLDTSSPARNSKATLKVPIISPRTPVDHAERVDSPLPLLPEPTSHKNDCPISPFAKAKPDIVQQSTDDCVVQLACPSAMPPRPESVALPRTSLSRMRSPPRGVALIVTDPTNPEAVEVTSKSPRRLSAFATRSRKSTNPSDDDDDIDAWMKKTFGPSHDEGVEVTTVMLKEAAMARPKSPVPTREQYPRNESGDDKPVDDGGAGTPLESALSTASSKDSTRKQRLFTFLGVGKKNLDDVETSEVVKDAEPTLTRRSRQLPATLPKYSSRTLRGVGKKTPCSAAEAGKVPSDADPIPPRRSRQLPTTLPKNTPRSKARKRRDSSAKKSRMVKLEGKAPETDDASKSLPATGALPATLPLNTPRTDSTGRKRGGKKEMPPKKPSSRFQLPKKIKTSSFELGVNSLLEEQANQPSESSFARRLHYLSSPFALLGLSGRSKPPLVTKSSSKTKSSPPTTKQTTRPMQTQAANASFAMDDLSLVAESTVVHFDSPQNLGACTAGQCFVTNATKSRKIDCTAEQGVVLYPLLDFNPCRAAIIFDENGNTPHNEGHLLESETVEPIYPDTPKGEASVVTVKPEVQDTGEDATEITIYDDATKTVQTESSQKEKTKKLRRRRRIKNPFAVLKAVATPRARTKKAALESTNVDMPLKSTHEEHLEELGSLRPSEDIIADIRDEIRESKSRVFFEEDLTKSCIQPQPSQTPPATESRVIPGELPMAKSAIRKGRFAGGISPKTNKGIASGSMKKRSKATKQRQSTPKSYPGDAPSVSSSASSGGLSAAWRKMSRRKSHTRKSTGALVARSRSNKSAESSVGRSHATKESDQAHSHSTQKTSNTIPTIEFVSGSVASSHPSKRYRQSRESKESKRASRLANAEDKLARRLATDLKILSLIEKKKRKSGFGQASNSSSGHKSLETMIILRAVDELVRQRMKESEAKESTRQGEEPSMMANLLDGLGLGPTESEKALLYEA